jgi:hypothetical protein
VQRSPLKAGDHRRLFDGGPTVTDMCRSSPKIFVKHKSL